MAEQLTALEADWRLWLRTLFSGYTFDKGGHFAPHHEAFWEWVWSIRSGERPRSFIAIWPRGGAKSTSAELACVALGARKARKYVLYISGTQEQADDHVASIAEMLESEEIEQYYPALGRRHVGKYGSSKGWKRTRLWTDDGFVIDALGLDTKARGVKLRHQRPDLMVFDDIDSEDDSPLAIAKKIKVLTKKYLPAGSSDMAVLGAQNLIHENSIFSMFADGRADFLSSRIVSGPIPALRGFEYEPDAERTEREGDGRIFYKITKGEPSWLGQDLNTCQGQLDDYGLAAFLTECQHKVRGNSPGSIYPEWNELVHVITWTEFAEFFGDAARDEHTKEPRIPATWNLGCGQDFGTTVGHPCVTIWAARPSEYDDARGMNDCIFIYRELVRPFYPSGETFHVSPRAIADLINEKEGRYREGERMGMRLMSHEQSAALNTYLYDLPAGQSLNFGKWTPDKVGGIAQVQNYLKVDRSQQHPFRPVVGGQPLMGRPRLYVVVPDGEGGVYTTEDGEIDTHSATSEAGLKRFRDEVSKYHYPATVNAGEKRTPFDLFNDAMDATRGLASEFFPAVAPVSDAERRRRRFYAANPHLTPEAIESHPDKESRDAALQTLDLAVLESEQVDDGPTYSYFRR